MILFSLAYFVTLCVALFEHTNAKEARKSLKDLEIKLIEKKLGEYIVHPKTNMRAFKLI